MKRVLSLVLFTLSASLAAPVQISYRTFHYACRGMQTVSVAYANFGKDGPMFAVLTWKGQQYALAEAISASGARYAGLNGPDGARGGLEWWEHQGEGTLITFVNGDTTRTKTLLSGCKVRR